MAYNYRFHKQAGRFYRPRKQAGRMDCSPVSYKY